MLQVRFEPTIPAFERAKTVHDLDRSATVISTDRHSKGYFSGNGNVYLYFGSTRFESQSEYHLFVVTIFVHVFGLSIRIVN
jgi:hypothetical protein